MLSSSSRAPALQNELKLSRQGFEPNHAQNKTLWVVYLGSKLLGAYLGLGAYLSQVKGVRRLKVL
jgi:hypothetical protein